MLSYTLYIVFMLNGQVLNAASVYEPTFQACDEARQLVGGQTNIPGVEYIATCKAFDPIKAGGVPVPVPAPPAMCMMDTLAGAVVCVP